jgi:hypothetical protein
MSCRAANWLRNSVLVLALSLAGAGAAQASSLDEFNTALANTGEDTNARLSRAASFAAALAEDIIDEKLTIQQRTAVLYGEALDDVFMKHYGQAIDEFTVLIDGSDSRVGELPADSSYFTNALAWRARCYAETANMTKAVRDVDRAAELRPTDATIQQIHDEIHEKAKKGGALAQDGA